MNKGLIGILSAAAGYAGGIATMEQTKGKKLKFWRETSNKHLEMIKLYDQWVAMKQEGKSAEDYFTRNNIKTIAVYGMSFMGERLCAELKDSDIEVRYGIDKNANGLYSDIDIVSPDDDLEDVDAIIVTAVHFFNEIEDMLNSKTDALIISLEDVLYEV